MHAVPRIANNFFIKLLCEKNYLLYDNDYLIAVIITFICAIICGIVLYKVASINIYFKNFAVINKHMCHSPDNFAVLDNGTTAHSLHNPTGLVNQSFIINFNYEIPIIFIVLVYFNNRNIILLCFKITLKILRKIMFIMFSILKIQS